MDVRIERMLIDVSSTSMDDVSQCIQSARDRLERTD